MKGYPPATNHSDLLRQIIGALFWLLPALPLSALVPTYTNLGAPVPTYGVQEQIAINTVVFPQDGTLQNPPVPTGTVSFTVNGLPVGSPFPVSAQHALVSFALPGTYPLVAHYSGDNFYAPSTSTYSFSLDVEANPARFGFSPAASSMTIASGATSGNTVSVAFVYLNGFHGSQEYSCSISESNSEPAAASPATCALSTVPNFDGFAVNVITTPPRTVTTSSKTGHFRFIAFPAMAILLWTPLALRRRRISVLLGTLNATLLFTIGCAGRSMGISPPTQSLTISSAGHYTVNLSGRGYDQVTGEITLAQPAEISVTVQ